MIKFILFIFFLFYSFNSYGYEKIHVAVASNFIEPLNLIKKTGNYVYEIPDGHICCGSAGTYNILQSEMAQKLLKSYLKP